MPGYRAEPTLRLWLFMGVCGILSALLLVALAIDDGSSLVRSHGSTPVFLPTWPLSLASWPTFASHESWEANMELVPTNKPTIQLVETVPVGDFQLNSTLRATHQVLLEYTQKATHTIDISAMYWNLLGTDDRKVYTPEAMQRFGADRGTALFEALLAAAKRNVTIRIVTSGDELAIPDELQQLMNAAPTHVLVHTWSGQEWYGGGILHKKLWIFDQQHVYIGSANMDWKSLAQVMEMGVLLEELHPDSHVLRDIQRLFDVWWLWGELDPKAVTTYYSQQYQAKLQVPTWSRHVPHGHRTKDPFVEAGLEAYSSIVKQLKTTMADGSVANLFVASAPEESTARATRTADEEALVYTIATAEERVSLSVMDFTPYSMYNLETHKNASIWWPALTDAIMAGVYGKRGLHVRLLVSQWQSSKQAMFEALKGLERQAGLCKFMQCGGRLEIQLFRVPGWQNTTSTSTAPPLWPSYTRVNHAKYIVTDRRVNIGTSNMEWGYFYTTAGISVNTDHKATREAMEEVFNRNWASEYAVPLSSVFAEEP